jgi:hypothetical protein
MDVSCERNVTTLLTTIISNAITITILGICKSIKQEKLSKESSTVVPSLSAYMITFSILILDPIEIVKDATRALSHLIMRMTLGFPYKYIRLLSDATYFYGYDSQDEKDQDKQDGNEDDCTLQIDDDQTLCNDVREKSFYASHRIFTNSAQFRMVWLPEYWPEKVREKKPGFHLLVPPDEAYISDPAFDVFFSVKSVMGCVFGIVQCASGIVISCMRLHNINMVHTMDVLSMYTSYILFCTVISVSLSPAYYCKPVVCIPRNQVEKFTTIGSGLAPRSWRLYIATFFAQQPGHALVGFLLFTPVYLLFGLLAYINKSSTLLLSLSAVWVFASVFGHLLISDPYFERSNLLEILILGPAVVILGLLITLIVYSCLYATTEQRYPSSASWLPHF